VDLHAPATNASESPLLEDGTPTSPLALPPTPTNGNTARHFRGNERTAESLAHRPRTAPSTDNMTVPNAETPAQHPAHPVTSFVNAVKPPLSSGGTLT